MASDRYKYFRIEAAELLEQLSRGLLAVEQSGVSDQLVGGLLRQAHTLKGAARVVRQIEIADAAHAIEDELARAQTPGFVPNVQSLLDLVDQCTRALAMLGSGDKGSGDKGSGDNKVAQLDSEPLAAQLGTHQVVRAELREVDAVREGISESLAELAQLRADSEVLLAARELVELIERQVLAPRLPHVRQYELLLRSTHSTVSDALHGLRRFERRFNATLDRAERELSLAHESAEQLRLVEARTTFSALERAVRDAATELGKDVRFEARGGDVKLDSHILDTVHRALVQMVRNAVAHGIEAPGLRLSIGKPASGLVKVDVVRQGHNICFSCHDDGGGIDVKRLSKLATADASNAPLDDAALLSILLSAGVSTSSKVSSVSGRGVGMGIVKEAVESVHAKVHLKNSPGAGLRLELIVPATLTSLAGLWVDSGAEVFVLPLADVQETVRVGAEDLIGVVGGERHLRVGDEILPYAPLHALVGRPAPDSALRAAVVLQAGSERIAAGVARLLGSKTQVLHRLPEEVGHVDVVSGVMLDALGNPQLVLDTAGLIAAKHHTIIPTRPEVVKRPILVVDDSLTTRMLQQNILESAGYSVELATSAEQALEMANEVRYALFLVDVEMPGMDGFTFVERTRADRRFQDVPAILVSSRSSASDLARGEAAGAKAYMVKDRFDQRELLRWVRNILGY